MLFLFIYLITGAVTYHFSTKVASADAVSFADFIGSESGEDGLVLQQSHGKFVWRYTVWLKKCD